MKCHGGGGGGIDAIGWCQTRWFHPRASTSRARRGHSRVEGPLGSIPLWMGHCKVTLSHCHIVTLSHCHIVTLSHCHRAPLGSSHYGRGSALHCGETRWVTWSLGTRAPTIQLLSLWFLCPCAYTHYIHCHIYTLYWDAAIPESRHLIQEPTASMIRWSYEAAVVGCQKSRETTDDERKDRRADRQTDKARHVCRQMTPTDKAIPVFIMARCVVSVVSNCPSSRPQGKHISIDLIDWHWPLTIALLH